MIQPLVKIFDAPLIDKDEVLRYARSSSRDELSVELVNEVVDLAENAFSYSVCYAELPFSSDGEVCDFLAFKVKSKNLSRCLAGTSGVLVFAATVGVGIDRLISKYTRIAPSKALMLDALGAERIEALCDAFCDEYKKEKNVLLTPRFSAGYGDCPLVAQRHIFDLLNCQKSIGLTLNDSMLMSPTKSVTAFVGIKEK